MIPKIATTEQNGQATHVVDDNYSNTAEQHPNTANT